MVRVLEVIPPHKASPVDENLTTTVQPAPLIPKDSPPKREKSTTEWEDIRLR